MAVHLQNFEILIIDDNAEIRLILQEILFETGYKTRLAANYNQALTEIDKKLPDVAIIDVKLDKSENDGIELLNHIKTKNKDIPVIIISGHANIEMAIKSLKSGAFEFIQKPFDKNRLVNFVNRAVENFNLISENKKLQKQLFHSFDLIGSSQNIDKIKDQIEKLSNNKASFERKSIKNSQYIVSVNGPQLIVFIPSLKSSLLTPKNSNLLFESNIAIPIDGLPITDVAFITNVILLPASIFWV